MLRIYVIGLISFIAQASSFGQSGPNEVERYVYSNIVDPVIDVRSRSNIRYLTPVNLSSAKGLVGEVYRQCQETFAPPAEPFLLQSPSPEVLLGFWLVSYESFVPVVVPRSAKEVIAVTVSEKNESKYCSQAHRVVGLSTMPGPTLGKALCEESFRKSFSKLPNWVRPYHEWALSSEPDHRKCGVSLEQLPETAAVTLVFHYINRLINVFTKDAVFQVTGHPALTDPFFRSVAEWRVGKLARAYHRPFLGIELAEKYGFRGTDSKAPSIFEPGRIRHAFALWGEIMGQVKARLVENGVSQSELEAIEFQIARPSDQNRSESIAVRFAVTAALHPEQVDPHLIRNLRIHYRNSDRFVVELAAWAAFLSTQREAEKFR